MKVEGLPHSPRSGLRLSAVSSPTRPPSKERRPHTGRAWSGPSAPQPAHNLCLQAGPGNPREAGRAWGTNSAAHTLMAIRATHATATPCANIREAELSRRSFRRTRTWQSTGSGFQRRKPTRHRVPFRHSRRRALQQRTSQPPDVGVSRRRRPHAPGNPRATSGRGWLGELKAEG